MEHVQVLIPFSRGELVELFHRRGHVDQETHEDDGTLISGRIPRSLRGYFLPFDHVSSR